MITNTENYTPKILAHYAAHYYQHDVWANRGMAHPKGVMMASEDLISDAEFRETVLYRDHCRHAGCFYIVGALVPIGGPNDAFGAFGVHRAESDGLFPATAKQFGTLLLPHLKRALQLRERLARLEIQHKATLDAMATLSIGILVVGEDARILFANPVAEALLCRDDGLLASNDHLLANWPTQHQALRSQIRDAARASTGRAAQAGRILRIPRREGKPLHLSIYPFTAPMLSDGSRLPAALIFIADPDTTQTPPRDALAQMYGLTAAEAKLFEALLVGERLQDYADRHSVSLHTVKTQLAHIFDKTGHARQTDLVRDALSNPILHLNR
jgi:DNA-binding CsgD family transcriptional regulator/PAS domain-containing protein